MHSSENQSFQRLLLTPGEPAGIGPDLAIMLVQQDLDFECITLADPGLLAERARQLGMKLRLEIVDATALACTQPQPGTAGRLMCLPVTLQAPVTPGQCNPANAGYVLHALDTAIDLCMARTAHALVTGPVHKASINQAGIPFSGHTEYLAQRCGIQQPVMLLATPGLRVALATTHLPLRAVADQITVERLCAVLSILHKGLQEQFGIRQPHILVSGLNPHAGESGQLGREEIEIIEPALHSLRAQGMHITGPLPADTLFNPRHLQGADAVLAMYHDQGLPVLKHMGFGQAANITLGLPILRTSVDHGTALELAGSGQADCGSLQYALATALELHPAGGL